MSSNGNGLHEWYNPEKAVRLAKLQAETMGRPWRKWIVAGFLCLIVALSVAILLSGNKSALVLTNWPR